MLELRIINAGKALPLFDLPMHLGRQKAVREIGDTIEGLIAFMDDLGGDPDLEDSHDQEADMSDYEPDDDAKGDISWTEWHTRGRHKAQHGREAIRGRSGWTAGEDDEDDDPDTSVEDHPQGFDPEEDRCPAGDDVVIAGPVQERGYWLTRHRSFYPAGHDIGSEDDTEHSGHEAEQWEEFSGG